MQFVERCQLTLQLAGVGAARVKLIEHSLRILFHLFELAHGGFLRLNLSVDNGLLRCGVVHAVFAYQFQPLLQELHLYLSHIRLIVAVGNLTVGVSLVHSVLFVLLCLLEAAQIVVVSFLLTLRLFREPTVKYLIFEGRGVLSVLLCKVDATLHIVEFNITLLHLVVFLIDDTSRIVTLQNKQLSLFLSVNVFNGVAVGCIALLNTFVEYLSVEF